MARPCKAIETMSKHLTTAEKTARLEQEQNLKGKSDKLAPPEFLSESQKKIFDYITQELSESKILGNLDVYVLTLCCVAIDRLQTIEMMINNDSSNLYSKDILAAKDRYAKDFYRCCSELSLSPQSRAKLANLNVTSQKDRSDPLINALKG